MYHFLKEENIGVLTFLLDTLAPPPLLDSSTSLIINQYICIMLFYKIKPLGYKSLTEGKPWGGFDS